MQKIIKIDNKVIVMFEDGCCLENDNITDEVFSQITNAEDDETIYLLMCPQYKEKKRVYEDTKSLMDEVENSELLSIKGEGVYWDEVSELSMPTELIKAVLKAEKEDNSLMVETLKNFWTLMSLNPDAECRKNLFWFLNRNGLQLSKHGFFVAYRNVDTTDTPNVYTDHHTHSFKIKIGDMVTMPREDCDCRANQECSRGLHLASKNWLNKNYYGTVGLVCLCNPADVVSVPYNSEYGKLRTCAYLPIDIINYGEDGHPIIYPAEDGFDCSYITKVIYEGLMGTEEDTTYKIVIPELPGVHRKSTADRLLDIAIKCINEKGL